MAWSVLCTTICVMERGTAKMDQMKRDAPLSAKQVCYIHRAEKQLKAMNCVFSYMESVYIVTHNV